MSPAAKGSTAKKSTATTATPEAVVDLSPDQVDAILRDPQVPGDVRAQVQAHYDAQRYLQSVTFTTDGDGVTHISREA